MTPEKKVQNAIISYFNEMIKNELPLFYEHRTVGGANYKKGIPDLYCVYNGIHIEIEVKQIKGSLSSMQEKWRDRFKKKKIPWICPKSFDDFLEQFNNVIKQKSSTL